MMEHRQGECRLGDEDVAGHRLEGRAGRVGPALEIARHDDALAFVCKHCLRRSQDVAGRREAHIDLADPYAFAIFQRLLVGIGHILEACAHDRQRFGSGQCRTMAGPRMVAMAVRDHGARHGDGRIDIEIAGLAIEAARRRIEPGAGI
jgi:hypothetical protein